MRFLLKVDETGLANPFGFARPVSMYRDPLGFFQIRNNDRRLDKDQFAGRLGVFGAEQQLQCEPFAEQLGRNVGGDDAPCDVGVLAHVVKAGERDRVRQAVRVVVEIRLHEIGNIVAGAHESGRPAL